jgi:hypothetical protein
LDYIWNSRYTTTCSGGVDLRSYKALWGATREGEVVRERGGAWRRGDESPSKDLPLSVVHFSSSRVALYIG